MQDILINRDIRIREVYNSVIEGNRISVSDAEYLFENAGLGVLAVMADRIKRKLFGKDVYYNKNFHIEPTNVCVFNCEFCSFSARADKKAWKNGHAEILDIVTDKVSEGANEVHITGGANPDYNMDFYIILLKSIRKNFPDLHIKAFTAVEVSYIAKLAGIEVEKLLKKLKEAGLNSLPGGGAEIFDKSIRETICKNKISGEIWLKTHETAHKLGLHSNATMLYGHVETIKYRLDHLERIRELQDKTNGFNAFIPLKFKNKNNNLSHIPETPFLDDLKTFAISRIFMDNIPHIKAYWPMIGKDKASLLLNFGVDDIDGTIQNTTKIYSMAGSKETTPAMTEKSLQDLIISAGFKPVERNSLYEILEK